MKNLKIMPAHSLEAKAWADALFCEWDASGMPLDVTCFTSKPPTLEEVREALAVTLGYTSWDELIDVVSNPHEPLYITAQSKGEEMLGERLSRYIKYNYSHGMVLNMLENAGVGYSPSDRRALLELTSPWGLIVEQQQLAEGILLIETAGHGGLKLTESLADAIPSHLTNHGQFYEEDEAFALVYLAFPHLFPLIECKAQALSCLYIFTSLSVPRSISQADIDFLSEFPADNVGYQQNLEDEELNRDLTKIEKDVIRYLSECVLSNKRPIATPDVECTPSLSDWVLCLTKIPNIDGTWKKTDQKWKEHFYFTRSRY